MQISRLQPQWLWFIVPRRGPDSAYPVLVIYIWCSITLEKHCCTAKWSPVLLLFHVPIVSVCWSLYLEGLLPQPPGKSRRINHFSRSSWRCFSFDLLKRSIILSLGHHCGECIPLSHWLPYTEMVCVRDISVWESNMCFNPSSAPLPAILVHLGCCNYHRMGDLRNRL